MDVSISNKLGDFRVVLVCEGEQGSLPEEGKKRAEIEGFSGKSGESLLFFLGVPHMAIGLGKKSDLSLQDIMGAVASGFKYAEKRYSSMSITSSSLTDSDLVRASALSVFLSSFRFLKFKSKKEDETVKLSEVFINVEENDSLNKVLSESVILANAQNFSREIDEYPPNEMTPEKMAEVSKKLAESKGLHITVFGEKELKEKGMNAILGVARGSSQEPKMIILEYNKDKKDLPLFAVVGKGITFDSGGISLKPSKNMDEMKYDKSGACDVLGIMKAVSELSLPIRLVGVLACSENMPGGNAQKPSDIVKAYNGKTIEVLNTDAEGRLVLADALSYVSEMKPKAIIDLATLTGAVLIALGTTASAVISNDDSLWKKILSASTKCGEKVWRLPLWKEHSEDIKGTVGDVRNISQSGYAGTITGAAFLKEFVSEGIPWAHLDIAGVAWDKKGNKITGKGPTGYGVRLAVETLRLLSS